MPRLPSGEGRAACSRPASVPRSARSGAARLPSRVLLEAVVTESIDVIARRDRHHGRRRPGRCGVRRRRRGPPRGDARGLARSASRCAAPEVPDGAVAAQLDMLGERFADLGEVGTPLVDGDYAEIDVKGYVHDESIEASPPPITSTRSAPVSWCGARHRAPRQAPRRHPQFNAELPERFGDRAGQEVSFQVLVKETKRKVLPTVTDEWAAEVAEFDTAEALRADIATRLDLYTRVQAQLAVREGARRRRRPGRRRDPGDAREPGDGAPPARLRAPPPGPGRPGRDHPGVPRRHRPGPGGIPRQAPGRPPRARCAPTCAACRL